MSLSVTAPAITAQVPVLERVEKTKLEEMIKFARINLVDPRILKHFPSLEDIEYGIRYEFLGENDVTYMLGLRGLEAATLLDVFDYVGKHRDALMSPIPIAALGSRAEIEGKTFVPVVFQESGIRTIDLVEAENSRSYRRLIVKRPLKTSF